jgi:hypothetical protein
MDISLSIQPFFKIQITDQERKAYTCALINREQIRRTIPSHLTPEWERGPHFNTFGDSHSNRKYFNVG